MAAGYKFRLISYSVLMLIALTNIKGNLSILIREWGDALSRYVKLSVGAQPDELIIFIINSLLSLLITFLLFVTMKTNRRNGGRRGEV